jgi:hypothetical protein
VCRGGNSFLARLSIFHIALYAKIVAICSQPQHYMYTYRYTIDHKLLMTTSNAAGSTAQTDSPLHDENYFIPVGIIILCVQLWDFHIVLKNKSEGRS